MIKAITRLLKATNDKLLTQRNLREAVSVFLGNLFSQMAQSNNTPRKKPNLSHEGS